MKQISRYIMTLVALFAMTAGAWAQETATITLKCGTTEKTYENVTLPWSTTAEILKEVVTDINFNININAISGGDGKVVKYGNENFTVNGTFSGDATVTVTYNMGSSATITVTAPAPLIALNDTKTEATMAAMPAYDATVSYELVRDMAVSMTTKVGDGEDGAEYRIRVKKDGESFVPAEMTLQQMMALFNVHDGIENQDLVFYGDGKVCDISIFAVDDQGQPTGDAIAFTALTPGRYVAIATAAQGTIYDGQTPASNIFELAEAYDLTLRPATNANLKSVTVGDEAVTPTDGVIKNIEPAKKVKITTTGPDYIIRKATVKKTGAATLLTVHVGGQANATLTYEEGQTWGEAIEKYPTENAAFTTQGNWVLCNGITVYDGNWNGVTKGTKVDPNATYTAIDA